MSGTRLYLKHLGILALGFTLGVLLAWSVTILPYPFTGEIERARALGITSLSIRAGYPKNRDVLNYLAMMVLPVGCAIGLWLLCGARRERDALLALLDDPHRTTPLSERGHAALAIGVAAVFLLLTFDLNYFFAPTNRWMLLAEEGQILAWVQSIGAGGVYGRDFYCLYGPLFIYPLAALMRLLGPSIVVERVYTHLVNVTAYGIMIGFLYRTLRTRIVFLCGAALCLLVFFPVYLSANQSPLRAGWGVATLLLLFDAAHGRRRTPVAAAGLTLGTGLLFSQEAGLCAAIAAAGFLAVQAWATRDWRRGARDGALVAAGALTPIVPVLLFLYRHDALRAALTDLIWFPRLATLGLGSLPFPTLSQFLRAPLAGGALFHYWILVVYAFTAVQLLVLLILGVRDRIVILRSALLVFGLLLYRTTLQRADEIHLYTACLPALLLCILAADAAVSGMFGRAWDAASAGRLALVAAATVSLVLLFRHSLQLQATPAVVWEHIRHPTRQWSRRPGGVIIQGLQRAGVAFDEKSANWILWVRAMVDRATQAGDYVYFFPNEPLYYFLFDRNNPTRYAQAYFAATTAQRQELVADLERRRPEYVVYSLGTWRVDNIPEREQLPEITAYLAKRYRPSLEVGDIRLLRRAPD